jgi:hydroxymethylpyrimidine/phosphomethylpyrimidine kinase
MVAKSGDRLVDGEAERAFVERLIPLATLVTPNLHEAAALLRRPVRDLAEMHDAARDLRALGPGAVLVKGGSRGADAVDVFFDGSRLVELSMPRVDTPNVHGTGCALSAAICARLARGDELLDAVRGAKGWLGDALRRSYAVGRGRGVPDHLEARGPVGR